MSTEVGTLVIDLKAQVARLEKDMKSVAAGVKKGTDQIESGAATAKKALVAMVAALGINKIKDMLVDTFGLVDANAKLADQIGATTEKTAGLKHAMDLAGVSENALQTGARTLAGNLADAARGSGKAADAFKALHLNASQLLRLPFDQQLEKILDALSKVENVTLRNAYASDVFGGRTSEMVRLITEGGDGIRRATADAEAWGLALNRVDSAEIEQAGDAVTRAKGAFQGMLNTVAVQLSPIITALANGFADSAREANGYKEEIVTVMDVTSTVIAYGANVARGLHVVWDGLKLAIAELINLNIQLFAAVDRGFTDMINKVSGSWVGKKLGMPMAEYAKVLDDVATISQARVEEIRTEFQDLVMQEMPADKVLAWFAKVKAESKKVSEQIAKDRQAMLGNGDISSLGDEMFEKLDQQRVAEFAKWMESEQVKMAAMDESFLSQLAKEELQYQLRSEQAQRWRDAQLIDDERLAELQTKLAEDHAKKREAIEAQTANTIRTMHASVWQNVAGILQSFAGKSKVAALAVIAINKGLAIAQTIQSTAAAVMRCFADLGPIAGAPAAAQIKILGGIQVGLIAASGLAEASQVGSGGASLGSAGNPVITSGGSPAPFSQPTGQDDSRTTVIINSYGPVVGSGAMQELVDNYVIPGVQKSMERDVVMIPRNSRQAQEILLATA